MADKAQEVQPVDPLTLFTPGVRLAVTGLSLIGQIEREVDYCGHKFKLRTLRPADKAAIALAIKPWRETLAEAEVWQNAHVGLALTSVDDRPDFCDPVGPSIEEFARGRLNYITNSKAGWFQPTLGFLYAQYLELEAEALAAIQELENLSQRSRQPLPPSPDSLTTADTSTEPTFLDLPSQTTSD